MPTSAENITYSGYRQASSPHHRASGVPPIPASGHYAAARRPHDVGRHAGGRAGLAISGRDCGGGAAPNCKRRSQLERRREEDFATRAVAHVLGLDFHHLISERYDLVIRKRHLALPSVQSLMDTLSRAAFKRELEGLGGYDTGCAGKRLE
jgi:hypothetical protein